SDPDYRGEIYFLNGNGKVTLKRFIPGQITFDYESLSPDADIEINTNWLSGWSVESARIENPATTSSNVTLKSSLRRLLSASVPAGRGEITLKYTPAYLPWTMALFFSGIVLA